MKALLKFLILIILLMTISGTIAFFLAVDDKAHVTSISAASVDDAKASHKIVKTLWENLIVRKSPFVLSVSESEFNGQFVLINRAISRIKGRAEFNQNLDISLTLELPRNPIGRFVNIHCSVLPSANGLSLGKLSIGAIPIHESIAISVGKNLLDIVSGQELGTITLDAIDAVAINGSQVHISIAPIPDLKERLTKTKERFKFTRDIFPQFGDPATVSFYYQALMQYDQNEKRARKDSFTHPIQAIFTIARQRGSNPVEENKAAILALAMFYGSESVGGFVGNVKTVDMENYYKRSPNLTLKHRNDLTRHFIISAALKIISEKDITNAIGEFKELLDARSGGSGFSFVDLAADRAGVKFAEALLDPKTASTMQQLLSKGAEETLIFPRIYGLPEEISQAAFQKQYSNVKSAAYTELVDRIDGCISELPAYQLNNYSVSREINACKF